MRIRPFSAFSYIRNNFFRSLVLILMMSFITVCFIGGMYVDNPIEMFRLSNKESDRYILIDTRGSSNTAVDEYRALQEELLTSLSDEYEILYVNTRYWKFTSIMSFDCNQEGFIFKSVEDFEKFKKATHLVPEEVVLKDREVVVSRQLANNAGMKLGETINPNSTVVVASIMDTPGIYGYGVVDTSTGAMLIIKKDGVCDAALQKEMRAMAKEMVNKYPHVEAHTASMYMEEIEQEMFFMKYIFIAVIVIVGVVLLVTINAAFTAAYDKRKHEFAIYKALGFTGGQIFRKVASEVLVMNFLAMVLGAILNAGVILALNQWLWAEGQRFWRISPMAIWGTLAAEVAVITTIILLNWRKVRKCEVTEE